MTTKPEEYRAEAQRCRQMADQVISPLDKEMWLQLAADWLAMASIRERSTGQFNATERIAAPAKPTVKPNIRAS